MIFNAEFGLHYFLLANFALVGNFVEIDVGTVLLFEFFWCRFVNFFHMLGKRPIIIEARALAHLAFVLCFVGPCVVIFCCFPFGFDVCPFDNLPGPPSLLWLENVIFIIGFVKPVFVLLDALVVNRRQMLLDALLVSVNVQLANLTPVPNFF